MGVDVDGQEWLQHRPQLIRNAESRGGAVIRRALSASFLGFFFVIPPSIARYSDRLLVGSYRVVRLASDGTYLTKEERGRIRITSQNCKILPSWILTIYIQ